MSEANANATGATGVALLLLAEQMTPLLDAVVGYRERVKSLGFSDAAAEQMALAFHQMMLAQMGATKGAA